MDRRKFLAWVGTGCLASSLPVALAACQGSSPTSSTTDGSAGGTTATAATADDGEVGPLPGGKFAMGTVEVLDTQGFLRESPGFASGAVYVVRDLEAGDKLIALDSRCTHQGCSVDWEAAAQNFSCPCHGSVFAVDGSVLEGPATEPLASFTVDIENDVVIVQEL